LLDDEVMVEAPFVERACVHRGAPTARAAGLIFKVGCHIEPKKARRAGLDNFPLRIKNCFEGDLQ
jgi:hypothetical protein